jgi:hypothetical protein
MWNKSFHKIREWKTFITSSVSSRIVFIIFYVELRSSLMPVQSSYSNVRSRTVTADASCSPDQCSWLPSIDTQIKTPKILHSLNKTLRLHRLWVYFIVHNFISARDSIPFMVGTQWDPLTRLALWLTCTCSLGIYIYIYIYIVIYLMTLSLAVEYHYCSPVGSNPGSGGLTGPLSHLGT